MRNKIFSSLILVCCFLSVNLIACGGGGGGSSSSSSGGGADSNSAKLSANTIVVEHDTSLTLQNINGNVFTYSYTGSISNIQPGKMLLSGEGNGYLRKVISVQNVNGNLIVNTEQASLEDAFEQLNLDVTIDTATSSFKQSAKILPLSVGEGKSINVGLPNYGSIGTSSDFDIIINNGSFNFAPVFDLKIIIEKNVLKEFKSVARGSAVFNLYTTIKSTRSDNYNFPEKSLIQPNIDPSNPEALPLFKVIIMAGPIPIVITSDATLKLGATLSVSVANSYDFNFTSTTNISAGVHYQNGILLPISTFGYTMEPEITNPVTLSGACSAKIYIRPKLGIYLYGVAGPYIDIRPYGKGSLVIDANPHLEAGIGISGNAGGEVKVLSRTLANINYELFDLYYKIKEWQIGTISPPSTPTGFTVTPASSSQINLSWNASMGTVTGYKIYRGGTYLTTVTTTSISDTGLSPSTSYCYTVSAYNTAGESNQSSQICATTQAPPLSPPSTPTGFTVTAASSSQINLSWNASTGTVTGYKIYRDGTYLKTVTTTSTSDTGLSPSTNYCYYVIAYNSAGDAVQTSQLCATTQNPPLSPPSTPTGFMVIPASSTQINLSWNVSTGATGYKIYRGGTYLKSVTTTSTSDTGLNPSTNYCYYVIAYNSAGDSVQTSQLCATTTQISSWSGTKLLGTFEDDKAYGIAVDSSGNIYISGETRGNLDGQINAGLADAFVTKYSASGIKQWTRLLGTTSDDGATGVAVDNSGSIYVTGNTRGNLDGQINGDPNGFEDDIFLTKYNSAGIKQWTRLLGTQRITSCIDKATGVAVDNNGNIYVTGYTEGNLDGQINAGYYDTFLTKYSASGAKQWTRLLGTLFFDMANGIAVDSGGNIYITGEVGGDLDGQINQGFLGIGHDILLVKYDASGSRQWTRLLGTRGDDEATGVAVDSSGNIYVTGYTDGDLDGQINAGGSHPYDGFIAKYNSSGVKQWTRLLGTTSFDKGNGVAVDVSGNIYITGETGGDLDGRINAGYYDAFLTKYSAWGVKQWTRLLGTTSQDGATGIAVDSRGNIYVTGYTEGTLDGQINAGDNDAFLVKYDINGVRQ